MLRAAEGDYFYYKIVSIDVAPIVAIFDSPC